VASVGDTTNENELFHILYDGSVTDRQGWVAMGGQSDQLGSALEERYPDGPPDLKDAFRLGEEILQTVENRSMPPANLEVAILDRTRGRRKFRRLSVAQIEAILA